MFNDFQLYESSKNEIFVVLHCLGMTGSKKAAAGNLAASVGSSAFQHPKKGIVHLWPWPNSYNWDYDSYNIL